MYYTGPWILETCQAENCKLKLLRVIIRLSRTGVSNRGDDKVRSGSEKAAAVRSAVLLIDLDYALKPAIVRRITVCSAQLYSPE